MLVYIVCPYIWLLVSVDAIFQIYCLSLYLLCMVAVCKKAVDNFAIGVIFCIVLMMMLVVVRG
jgi:hypothetical protein